MIRTEKIKWAYINSYICYRSAKLIESNSVSRIEELL